MKTGEITLIFKTVIQPCVYRIFDEKKDLLYIGYSEQGLRRVFDHSGYERGQRSIAFEYGTSVTVTFYDSAEEARSAEADEIKSLQPKYNTVGKRRGRTYGKTPFKEWEYAYKSE